MPVQPTAELTKGLQIVAEELLRKTQADRTTVRIDAPNDPDYPVTAEARVPGMASITGGMSLKGYKPVDFHSTPTTKALRDERKVIIQRDVRVDPPAMPKLVEFYGITAQMLHPLEHEGEFVGLVSVHSVKPRDWSESDIEALQSAAARAQRELAQGIWVEVPRSVRG